MRRQCTAFGQSFQRRLTAHSTANNSSPARRSSLLSRILPQHLTSTTDGEGGSTSGTSSTNWRDTIGLAAILLLGSVLYDTIITNKDMLMAWVRECFIVTLEVRSSQEEFYVILEWLTATNAIGTKSKNLMVTEKGNGWRSSPTENSARQRASSSQNGDADQPHGWDIAPGIGTHRFVHNGRTFWFSRRFDSDKGKGVNLSDTLPQVLSVSCMGGDRAAMDALLKDIATWQGQRMAEKVPIYVVDGSEWVSVGAKNKRELGSIFLPEEVKSNLVSHLTTFLRSEDVYHKLGVPWRRGYLFHGPPGTGKSSLIAALASEFRLPVYLMSFKGGASGSDGGFGRGGGAELMLLTKLINSCPSPCLLVMEDLDTSAIATPIGEVEGLSSSGNVSGLLNALDGLPATDGKVLIITANDPGRLPKALLRPGRVDEHIAFTVMAEDERSKMVERFHTQLSCDGSAVTPRPDAGIESPAEVQNILLNELLYTQKSVA